MGLSLYGLAHYDISLTKRLMYAADQLAFFMGNKKPGLSHRGSPGFFS